MKANELMIGDWLIPYNEIEPRKVVSLGYQYDMAGKYDCVAFEGTPHTLNYTGFCKPIPLTPEILEKNEFIGMPYAVLKIDDDSWLEYYYHEHRLIKWWSGIDEWENHSKVKDITFQCHCIYVHELQHALKLCGIEKEIKL